MPPLPPGSSGLSRSIEKLPRVVPLYSTAPRKASRKETRYLRQRSCSEPLRWAPETTQSRDSGKSPAPSIALSTKPVRWLLIRPTLSSPNGSGLRTGVSYSQHGIETLSPGSLRRDGSAILSWLGKAISICWRSFVQENLQGQRRQPQ